MTNRISREPLETGPIKGKRRIARFLWMTALLTGLAAAGTLGASLMCGTTVATAVVARMPPGAEQTVHSPTINLTRGQRVRLESVLDYSFNNSSLVSIEATLTSKSGETARLSTSVSLGEDSEQGSGTGAWSELGEFVTPETGEWTLTGRLNAAPQLGISGGVLRLKTGTVNGFDAVPVLFTLALGLGLLGQWASRTRNA